MKVILLLLLFSFNAMAETKIKIIAGGREVSATLNDSATSKDFLERLPLEFSMNDLFGREKYYNFSEPLEDGNVKEFTFDVGDVFYWPPQKSFVIIYRQDGDTIPGGMYPLGRIDDSVDTFDNNEQSMNVKIYK